ncbi:hypothetical protein [Rhodopila sp.]|uniref:hypothetical protein n=1 Tax=Rhodopila sp. TaxID=2480087 RepID=UPI003D0BE90B
MTGGGTRDTRFAQDDRNIGGLMHGRADLPAVEVCAYNAELRDKDGFIGDRASKRGFQSILEEWRDRLRTQHEDPLGDVSTEAIGKKALDKALAKGEPEAAGLLLGAVEDFATELAMIAQRLLRTAGWRGVQRIAVGGGMRASRTGEIAIGRASVLLKSRGQKVELRPIKHHPDEAGLMGAAHLVPSWMLAGHDSLLAVDIGGTNMRVGLVELNLKEAPDLCAARVMGVRIWRHQNDSPTRDDAVAGLCGMLDTLIRRAENDKLHLAPFIGIGCPGVVRKDGGIERGAQNLPGNWQSPEFNLSRCIIQAVPQIAGQPTSVMLHNDAVIQGLSEVPWMKDIQRWGILTIGTGLGNASFANHGIV